MSYKASCSQIKILQFCNAQAKLTNKPMAQNDDTLHIISNASLREQKYTLMCHSLKIRDCSLLSFIFVCNELKITCQILQIK